MKSIRKCVAGASMFTQRTCPHEPGVRKDEPDVETGTELEVSREVMNGNERLGIQVVEPSKEKRCIEMGNRGMQRDQNRSASLHIDTASTLSLPPDKEWGELESLFARVFRVKSGARQSPDLAQLTNQEVTARGKAEHHSIPDSLCPPRRCLIPESLWVTTTNHSRLPRKP